MSTADSDDRQAGDRLEQLGGASDGVRGPEPSRQRGLEHRLQLPRNAGYSGIFGRVAARSRISADSETKRGFERGGWAIPLFDDEAATFLHEVYQRADAFLFGRRTYEIFAGYWGAIVVVAIQLEPAS